MEQKLRSEAKALLEQGKVDYIIGFEPGSLKFTTTPLITSEKDALDRLVINPFIANNLANFLTEIEGRTGIVVKGCDSRSVVSLIQDNKVAREDIIIIGVPCHGIIDVSKIEALLGKARGELDAVTRNGDKVTIKVDGSEREVSTDEVLFDNCLACEFPTPQEYDILLGEPIPAAANKEASHIRINELRDTSPEQRWQFWKEQFSRCIKCYACRNACPACFCERCFVEESEPQWLLPMPRWQDNLMFQAVRTIHVAGRCTDCGACERACPVNIPLCSLTKEMYDIVDDHFHFKAGTDKDALPLMVHYEQEETEDFIR
ncbi:4Fe-4S dicluster domain-containing protein [Chloroflexota bacterium]